MSAFIESRCVSCWEFYPYTDSMMGSCERFECNKHSFDTCDKHSYFCGWDVRAKSLQKLGFDAPPA